MTDAWNEPALTVTMKPMSNFELMILQFGPSTASELVMEVQSLADLRHRAEDLRSQFNTTGTLTRLHRIGRRAGIEIMYCLPVPLGALDVVGLRGREVLERYRPPGMLFRYFDSHVDRLADFQRRLDAAKQRARR